VKIVILYGILEYKNQIRTGFSKQKENIKAGIDINSFYNYFHASIRAGWKKII
jgi:hypothetical protein